MKMIKLHIDEFPPPNKSSLQVKQHKEPLKYNLPFCHAHPELELVYVNKANGKIHVGGHLSYYNSGQLILIGSNLPHCEFVDQFASSGLETIVQFKEDFLGADFFEISEMQRIKNLFLRAKQGVCFGTKTKVALGGKIARLNKVQGFDRILLFLEILKGLASTDDYSLLNDKGFAFVIKPQDNLKINVIFSHVFKNFHKPIPLSEIADKVNMTVPAFCRFYKKVTGKTFTHFVNEFRIVHATKLLAETNLSINDICFESGFNNFSHFNKLFKRFIDMNPLKYREEIKRISK